MFLTFKVKRRIYRDSILRMNGHKGNSFLEAIPEEIRVNLINYQSTFNNTAVKMLMGSTIVNNLPTLTTRST